METELLGIYRIEHHAIDELVPHVEFAGVIGLVARMCSVVGHPLLGRQETALQTGTMQGVAFVPEPSDHTVCEMPDCIAWPQSEPRPH